jgi:hypothetical protein
MNYSDEIRDEDREIARIPGENARENNMDLFYRHIGTT